ncbi:MAG: hypothetical protein IPF66_19560 [Holophagales bacterium]|nr:hypothetical protein [Holophagales bacterium]
MDRHVGRPRPLGLWPPLGLHARAGALERERPRPSRRPRRNALGGDPGRWPEQALRRVVHALGSPGGALGRRGVGGLRRPGRRRLVGDRLGGRQRAPRRQGHHDRNGRRSRRTRRPGDLAAPRRVDLARHARGRRERGPRREGRADAPQGRRTRERFDLCDRGDGRRKRLSRCPRRRADPPLSIRRGDPLRGEGRSAERDGPRPSRGPRREPLGRDERRRALSLRRGALHPVRARSGASIEIVNTIHEETDGTLWVGTYGGGLNRFRDGLFSAATTREGLFDDAVFAILPDGQGNLWISCNRGVYAVSLRELDALARGDARRVNCRPFGAEDGMRNRECNGANQPAGARGPDGRLHFPTIEGVVSVDPSGLFRNPVPPPVLVEEVMVDDAPAPARTFLELPPGKERFEFHYTALSLRVPSRVKFRVRLEGVDRDWIDVGTRRSAYYTHLSPGSYSFRVAAANESGIWNEGDASFSFRLSPRLDQRPFFWLLAGTLALAIAYTGYRFRVARLEARERELVEIVEERTRSLREEKERTEHALREAELQRERAEAAGRAAEDANRTKSHFLAATSHELRTPLNAILGYSEILSEEIAERGLEGLGPDVGKIHAAGRHLLGLINDILDLSRMEAGKLDLFPEEIDVAALVRDVAAAVGPQAEQNHNRLVVEGAGAAGGLVADPTRVRQILLNLLGNAVKFTHDGEITLGIRREKGPGGERIVFSVTDTGIGMTGEQISRLFRAFEQADPSVTRRFGGTGLGLVITRRLARMMGGDVAVASRTGEGSTFTVDIPTQPGPVWREPAQESRSQDRV